MDSHHAETAHGTGEGHESSDVPVGEVLGLILILGIGVAATIAVVWGQFLYYESVYTKAQGTPTFPLAEQERTEELKVVYPPAPRLEGIDPQNPLHSGVPGWPSEAHLLRNSENQVLAEWGPESKEKTVRVPIGTAIDLLAGKLPVRKEVEKDPQAGIIRTPPSDASSGRVKGAQ